MDAEEAGHDEQEGSGGEDDENCCLICLDDVAARDAVWNCRQCHCMFHLTCIQNWARNGVKQPSVLSDDLFPDKQQVWLWCVAASRAASVASVAWLTSPPTPCLPVLSLLPPPPSHSRSPMCSSLFYILFCACSPKCREVYDQKDTPTSYLCFCGKVRDPPFDPWGTPHSCGEPCGRRLRPDCGHTCHLLCHPGWIPVVCVRVCVRVRVSVLICACVCVSLLPLLPPSLCLFFLCAHPLTF